MAPCLRDVLQFFYSRRLQSVHERYDGNRQVNIGVADPKRRGAPVDMLEVQNFVGVRGSRCMDQGLRKTGSSVRGGPVDAVKDGAAAGDEGEGGEVGHVYRVRWRAG
jgi:hypothetical protein